MSNDDTKFTWSTEYEYESRDSTRWRFVEDDGGATYPVLLVSMKNAEQYWFTREGRYVFAIECHHRDIIAQHPIAPPVAETVPQWCRDAAKSIGSDGLLGLSYFSDEAVARDVAAIIARHAPKAEPQQVAILESMLANEERSCVEVLEERDTAIGFCDLFAATILGEDINWSCHETKWQEALDMLSNGKTIEVSGIMLRRSGDYAIVEAEVDGKWREVMREFIDAPFSHIVEPAGILQAKESELNAVPDGVEAEQPAVRYACSKLAAVGDTVKFVRGRGAPRLMKVTAISSHDMIHVEWIEGGGGALVHSSTLEFVPEITPAATVWPRYFEQRDRRGLYKRLKFESPTVCRWADGHSAHSNLIETMPERSSLDAVLKTHIETDAEGNAIPEKQEASGVESFSAYGIVGSDPCEVVKFADHDRVVRRLTHERDSARTVLSCSYDDWERAQKQRDDTIAELRAEMERWKKQTKGHSVNEQLFIDEARQQAAQCWCDEETKDRVMDRQLAEAVAKRIAAWMDTAAQAYRNTDFYRGIVTQIGEKFGKPAYTSDDGSVQQDVLALRVPELVDALRTRAEAAEAEVKRLQDALDENWVTHQQIINARTVRNGEYDTLHAMLVAEQQEHGRTGVERNEYAGACKHWRERAEAAEAKCAAAYRERDDILAQKGEAQGERSREVKNLTAQLAAANERVAALRAENERLRALLLKARPYIKQPHDVSKPWVVNEIDQALAQPSAEVGE